MFLTFLSGSREERRKHFSGILGGVRGVGVLTFTNVAHLGCELNRDTDINKELGKRMRKCIATLKSLDLFWLHSNCPKKFKIRVYNAAIRSKLMYGLETAQLNNKQLEDINKFQLKGFRFF